MNGSGRARYLGGKGELRDLDSVEDLASKSIVTYGLSSFLVNRQLVALLRLNGKVLADFARVWGGFAELWQIPQVS